MVDPLLSCLYHAYTACLNEQEWNELHEFVHEDVKHNGRALGLSGYRAMLVKDFEDIPDLRFNIDLLVCADSHVAARLVFECAPKGEFLGLKVDGRVISFVEKVFYEFEGDKIVLVWSIIDKVAIEAQLAL